MHAFKEVYLPVASFSSSESLFYMSNINIYYGCAWKKKNSDQNKLGEDMFNTVLLQS